MRQSEINRLSETREQLKFETLLVEISTCFVNLPAERIDDAIKDAQRRICDYLDLDRSALWQFSEKGAGIAYLTHIQQLQEAPVPDGTLDARNSFPWVLEQVQRQGIAVVSRLADLPPEAARDCESFQQWGTKSSVVVPLLIDGRVAGALSFARLRKEGDWPVQIIERFLKVAQVFANALFRKRTEEFLRERLEFESLLADMSTRFVNLSPEKIDSEIENAYRRVCECIGLDFSALWQVLNETPRNYVLTHSYRGMNIPALPERMTAEEYFPWCLKQVGNGEVIAVSTEEAPAEALRDQEVWRYYGIKSSLVIPLSAGGEPPIGAVSFNSIKTERTWPERLIKQLQLVAQIFANALARKYADLKFRENEERLRLATDAAGAGLWDMELDKNSVWVTPQTRQLFDFERDEKLTYDSFLNRIHPEDRRRVEKAVGQAVESGRNLRIEYRIVLVDGRIRWIAASGQRYRRPTGGSDHLLGVAIDISDRKDLESKLEERLSEITQLKCRIENENLYLRKELSIEKGFDKIVGESKAFKKVLMEAEQVASTEATVLILGETGTGKGMVANAIHKMSTRKDRPLVTVNCSALPQNLIESELFGREKGAFTGAYARQAGRFEVANDGTIFLDEIGEMPLELQAKLLRVLQEGEFERLGSVQTVKVNVRVIAATSRDLKQEVRAGRFREDLYYRLYVFPISIPPLRHRTDDIIPLAQFFTQKYGRRMGKQIESMPKATINKLLEYDWPGNVRELEHVIERGVIITRGSSLQVVGHLKSFSPNGSNPEPLKDLAAAEREHILKVLHETGWKIEGPSGAASILKIHPSTLRFRLKKLEIHRPS